MLVSDGAEIRLRTIDAADCERLRVWKNGHRRAFFYQEEITPEGQALWYAGYRARPDDYMFVIETRAGEAIGCVAVRLLPGGHADIYNVIVGDPAQAGRGYGGQAVRLASSYAHMLAPAVTVKVLRDNPAVAFYEKVGYDIAAEGVHAGIGYYEMALNFARFRPLPFRRVVRAAGTDG